MSRKFNAILGLGALAAFGFASSAFAQCPTGPVPPWTAQSAVAGSVAIAAGGYDTTACRLDARITGNLGSASAFVRDDTPADEPSYRAQFLINVDNLIGLNSTQNARVFVATTVAPANGVPDVVALTVFGNAAGTNKVLGIATACASSPTGRCSTTVPLTGGNAGVHRVEISWTRSATGNLSVWVNNTDPALPNSSQDVDNGDWGGVDSAALGLAAPTAGFRSVQINRDVGFDEFDSRRTSFIGL